MVMLSTATTVTTIDVATGVPGREASMGDDGVVAGGQQGEVVPDRVLILAIAFSLEKI
jgi:hypothetical protein